MGPFRYHVFVCEQQKAEGMACCAARGSAKVLEALRKEVAQKGVTNEVLVTACGSFGLCDRGPNMIVYPEGVWYSGVGPQDVPEIVQAHFQGGRVVERLANKDVAVLKQEICANRDKALAAQRAQAASSVLPDDMNRTLRGFQESRVILTAVELDLFTAVGNGATAEEVGARVSGDPRATEMLLNALVAMGWLAKSGAVFSNTPSSARYFVSGSADDWRVATLHLAHLWETWSTLTECVRAGTSVTRQAMAGRGEDWTTAFIAAMHRNARARAPLVVSAVGTEGVSRMLDVGGGSGAYSIAFACAKNDLEVDLLDLADVLPITQGHIESAGLAGRIRTQPGDLRADQLGAGYDLVLVSAICHMLGVDENRDLFKRCFHALAPKGRLVIQDFILEPDKTAPKSAALFALNMLVGTEGGSTYTEAEYAAWLTEAGFDDVRHVRLPGPSGLIIGRRV
ncbi:O-methyltransferase (modular protein) [Acidobacteriia bacterium SbA2]|nr:O-methyltransferase (modular protein) [Acidobacteriia bacterium SbA2]